MSTHTLHEVAVGCWDGACNPSGIIHSTSQAIAQMPFEQKLNLRESEDLRIIIDQLRQLVGPPTPGEFKP